MTHYFVYIIECGDGTFYTGIATDVARRFREHAQGIGARYTRGRGVRRVIYAERHRTRALALKRECAIKQFSRLQKRALAQGADVLS